MPPTTPSLQQLVKAVSIAEKIQTLEAELQSILGGTGRAVSSPTANAAPSKRRGKRIVSDEAKAKMSAAAKARHARKNESGVVETITKAVTSVTGKVKRVVSPEVKARLAAAMKARWAAAKKQGLPGPNARK